MLGRANIIDIIRKGDLEKLKKMLDKDQLAAHEWLQWNNEGKGRKSTSSGNALHAAAYFNKPQIIAFLVSGKGMDVNQPNQTSRRAPLHYAAEYGGETTVSLLLQLGADATLECRDGTAYQLCKDRDARELLRPFQEEREKEWQRQQDEVAAQRQEAAEQRALEKSLGTWTATSSTEITHQRELTGSKLQLTDVFNFESRCWIAIVKDLESGHPSQTVQFFDNMPDKEMLHQACVRLNEMGGNVDPAGIEKRLTQPRKAAAPQKKTAADKPVEGGVSKGYGHLTQFTR